MDHPALADAGEAQSEAACRKIGRVGTGARVLVGAAMLYGAFTIDGLQLSDAALGALVFPGTVLLGQWLRSRWSSEPLRATGVTGHLINNGIVIALIMIPPTRDAMLLFYGASMLLAAWRGYAGCEVLALSNWVLRRDDQVGCLLFSPIDSLEDRWSTSREPSAI